MLGYNREKRNNLCDAFQHKWHAIFSGDQRLWWNGETTWDQRVSEKSINLFWLVLRHQPHKSLWKWHYWFLFPFFMVSLCNNLWLQLEFVAVSLCVCCWMEEIFSFILFFVNASSFFVFFCPQSHCGPVRFQKIIRFVTVLTGIRRGDEPNFPYFGEGEKHSSGGE